MKTLTQKNTCTSIFITALFTIAEIRKQPMSIDGCMDKEDVYIQNGVHSDIKKRNLAICNNIDRS